MSDGYSDEDFEEYSEDGFEDEEEQQPTPPPPQAALSRPPLPNSGSSNNLRGSGTSTPTRPPAMETLPDAIMRENMVAARSVTPNSGSRPQSGRPGSASRRLSVSQPEQEPFHVPDLTSDVLTPIRKSTLLPSRDQLQSDAQIKALHQNKARRDAVMAAITLKESAFDNMYDAMPMSVFDLMAMGRGSFAGTAVAAVQTNDDRREADTQTDEVDVAAARCQVPEDQGVSRAELEAARTGVRKKAGSSLAEASLEADSERKLAAFVRSVGHLILKLLGEGEKSAEASPWLSAGPSGACGFSSACMRLESSNLLKGRRISSVAYSQEPVPRVLVAARPIPASSREDALQDHGLGARSTLCVWDARQPEQPTHQLLCEGTPSCCCWAPFDGGSESYLIFAGMEQGGVCLWDLREPGTRFPGEEIQGSDVSALRRPTYSTEFLPPDGEISGGVVALAAVPRAKKAGDGRRSKGNIQLLSCGMWGDVTMWSVNEMSEGDVKGTSEVDFGLRVGGRVRLLKTSALLRLGMDAARPTHQRLSLTLQVTHDICLLPRDTNEFVVGGDGGRVLMGARYGKASAPKEFKLEDWGLHPPGSMLTTCAAVTAVLSVHFSPFFPELFVAGFSSGTVALFSVRSSLPLMSWTEIVPGEARLVRWSPARPGVFFCLDPHGVLHAFDLSERPDGPVAAEGIPGGEVTALEVTYRSASEGDSNISPEDGWVSPAAGAGASPSSRGQQPVHSFVVGFSDGRVDVHVFSPKWATPAHQEHMAVSALLGLAD